ncbi:MAG: ABC-F family ATP-binding cassette domain-containing protein [Armatimonadetes bacterium]|nr:ABC-F family ATP-binding cassette domain-containing protein [Armatimonadota bacterium]
MSLLTVREIEKFYGATPILVDVSFRLEWRQKIGLVGRNGTGKTTLLRILNGDLEPDRGSATFARGIRRGYLRQEQMVERGRTVYQEAEDAFAPVLAMERRFRELEHAMAHGERVQDAASVESAMEEYGLLRDRFDAMGGYDNLRDIGVVLERMGFPRETHDKKTCSLSGGEKTRLALARLLLSGPDVLLLDEPTNHLDLQATEWLEGFLRDFGGAVILVSHDRYFLDQTVRTVAEIEGSRISFFTGNFSAYWEQKSEQRRLQEETFGRQQQEIERLEAFWRRNKAGQNRNMAWSRLKAADKIRRNGVTRPPAAKELRLKINERNRSGEEVVIVDRLAKGFGERTLFQDVNLLVERGQRLGIVGPNGSGKSTFLRTMLGLEAATAGSVRLGAGVRVGYFAQEASDLNGDLTLLETIQGVSTLTPGEARGFLARFLFTGDDVGRRVSALSGGEKNRLVLAQLVLAEPNLLVLDEPTNHLDLAARHALTEMLAEYGGTLILASHDRYLLDSVTDLTLEIARGSARLFDGPYSTFRSACEQEAEAAATPARAAAPEPEKPSATHGMNSFELSRARRQALKDIAGAEGLVAELEDLLLRIEETLSTPTPQDDIVKLSQDHADVQVRLEAAMASWEEASQRGEALGATQ